MPSYYYKAFGGILFSLFFHSISKKLQEWTGWKRSITLSIAALLVLIFYAGISYLIGIQVSQQYDEFAEKVPEMIEAVTAQIEDTAVGGKMVEKINEIEAGEINLFDHVQMLFMINPEMYLKGFCHLIPASEGQNTLSLLNRTGDDLKIWLRPIVLEMIFVSTLTAIGLLLLGIDLWLILALIAGFLMFIPNIGPALAIIPAFLVGLMSGKETALLIVGLYLLVRLLESGIFGPFIRQKLLSLPPALVLLFQLIMGVFTGGWGILFATPLLVVLINVINKYYGKRVAERRPNPVIAHEGRGEGYILIA